MKLQILRKYRFSENWEDFEGYGNEHLTKKQGGELIKAFLVDYPDTTRDEYRLVDG